MRVALHGSAQELNLSISKLVELSRLSAAELEKLLKDYPESKLDELTYRQVRQLVGKYNSKKRNRAPKNKDSKKELDKVLREILAPEKGATDILSGYIDLAVSLIGDGEIPKSVNCRN